MDTLARTPDQLAAALRGFRINRGLSQMEVAAQVGMRQATVSYLENNAERASVATLYKVLSSLGLELVVREKRREDTVGDDNTREW